MLKWTRSQKLSQNIDLRTEPWSLSCPTDFNVALDHRVCSGCSSSPPSVLTAAQPITEQPALSSLCPLHPAQSCPEVCAPWEVRRQVRYWQLSTAETQKTDMWRDSCTPCTSRGFNSFSFQSVRGCGILFGPAGYTSLRRSTWSKMENKHATLFMNF